MLENLKSGGYAGPLYAVNPNADEISGTPCCPDVAGLIGPNCFGVAVPSIGLDATFAAANPQPGPVGLLIQSGGLGSAMVDHLTRLDRAGPQPVIARPDGAVAVSARIRLAPPAWPDPFLRKLRLARFGPKAAARTIPAKAAVATRSVHAVASYLACRPSFAISQPGRGAGSS